MCIKGVKLIDFLNIYDFTMLNSNCEEASKWFELGVNDWSGNYYKQGIIEDFLNEKILNMYVYSLKVNWNVNTLEVFLQKEYGIED